MLSRQRLVLKDLIFLEPSDLSILHHFKQRSNFNRKQNNNRSTNIAKNIQKIRNDKDSI